MTELIELPDGTLDFKSHGKVIEIIPIIEVPDQTRHMLPPAVWHVPNWLVGFIPQHWLSSPYTILSHEQVVLPASNSARSSRLSWMLRLMEDHPAGTVDSVPIGAIDAVAVAELLDAIGEARKTPGEAAE